MPENTEPKDQSAKATPKFFDLSNWENLTDEEKAEVSRRIYDGFMQSQDKE